MNELGPRARDVLRTYARVRPGAGARERNWNAVQRRVASRHRLREPSLRRQLAWGFAAAMAAALLLLVLDLVLPRPDVVGLDGTREGSQAVHGEVHEQPNDVRTRADGEPAKLEVPPAIEPKPAAPPPAIAPPPVDPPRAAVVEDRAPPSTAPEPSDSLAIETQLVARARSALGGGDLDAAQAALDEHARRFPHGALEEDRVAYATIVACRRGDADARHAFLQRYPRSPHRPRVDEACR